MWASGGEALLEKVFERYLQIAEADEDALGARKTRRPISTGAKRTTRVPITATETAQREKRSQTGPTEEARRRLRARRAKETVKFAPSPRAEQSRLARSHPR